LNREEEFDNVILKKFDRKGFVKDLANSKAVIANAGFSLISESLYLKKPYLALPVKSQFEQTINAIYIEKLGYGEFHQELNSVVIEDFIANINYYRLNIEKNNKYDFTKLWKSIDNYLANVD
jgi:uncharacterized protein (TIGR00661 family)